MKKLLFLVSFLFALTGTVLAQGAEAPTQDYSAIFMTFGGLVAAVVAITEALKPVLKPQKKIWKILLSWGIGIVLCGFGYLSQLGLFLGISLEYLVILTIGVNIVANWGYDHIVKWILQQIGVLKTT